MDFAITSLKRKLWNNYTKCLFGGINATTEELWSIWLSEIKWNLKAIIIKYQDDTQQLNLWKLEGNWLEMENGNLQINSNSFIASIDVN